MYNRKKYLWLGWKPLRMHWSGSSKSHGNAFSFSRSQLKVLLVRRSSVRMGWRTCSFSKCVSCFPLQELKRARACLGHRVQFPFFHSLIVHHGRSSFGRVRFTMRSWRPSETPSHSFTRTLSESWTASVPSAVCHHWPRLRRDTRVGEVESNTIVTVHSRGQWSWLLYSQERVLLRRT